MPDDRVLNIVVSAEITATDAQGVVESLGKTTKTVPLSRQVAFNVSARVDVSDPTPDRQIRMDLT